MPTPRGSSCTRGHGAVSLPRGDIGGGDSLTTLAVSPLPLTTMGSTAQPCCHQAALAACPLPWQCQPPGGSRDSSGAGAGPSGHRWQCKGHGNRRSCLWASSIPWAVLALEVQVWAAVTPVPRGALCRGWGVLGNPQCRPPLPGSVGAAALALPPRFLSRLFISLRRSRPPLPPPPPVGRG